MEIDTAALAHLGFGEEKKKNMTAADSCPTVFWFKTVAKVYKRVLNGSKSYVTVQLHSAGPDLDSSGWAGLCFIRRDFLNFFWGRKKSLRLDDVTAADERRPAHLSLFSCDFPPSITVRFPRRRRVFSQSAHQKIFSSPIIHWLPCCFSFFFVSVVNHCLCRALLADLEHAVKNVRFVFFFVCFFFSCTKTINCPDGKQWTGFCLADNRITSKL